ncbi:MAG TPA: MazG nucleotide pyrophosphohydrolase domain-containing protein [Bacillota bacterium]|nr:MazG nucleotide pyrophosphohydrolase domain-containing protein [Bacillota bacterium]
MTLEQEMVRAFHLKYGHKVAKAPTTDTAEVRMFRARLVVSEAAEFLDACSKGDLVEMADALADILYVVYGAAVTFGIDLEQVFAEVHRSNMTKSQEKEGDGKTVKGPDYVPPDIRSIIVKQMESKFVSGKGDNCYKP